MKIIIYTVGLDHQNKVSYRDQAFLLGVSFRKTNSPSSFAVIHNGLTAILQPQSEFFNEIAVDLDIGENPHDSKFLARDVLDIEGYDWVLFLDSDCLVMSSNV